MSFMDHRDRLHGGGMGRVFVDASSPHVASALFLAQMRTFPFIKTAPIYRGSVVQSKYCNGCNSKTCKLISSSCLEFITIGFGVSFRHCLFDTASTIWELFARSFWFTSPDQKLVSTCFVFDPCASKHFSFD